MVGEDVRREGIEEVLAMAVEVVVVFVGAQLDPHHWSPSVGCTCLSESGFGNGNESGNDF